MATEETIPPPAASDSPAQGSDRPPERLVRHVFWKYPILAVVLLVVVAALAAAVGSPNWPKDTIASVTKDNPGGAILAFTQEVTRWFSFGVCDRSHRHVWRRLTLASSTQHTREERSRSWAGMCV